MIYTIGYGNKGLKYLINELLKNNINNLLHVRSIPYSKYNPDFNKDWFKYELDKKNINYYWFGKNIGGLGDNVNHEETLDKIAKEYGNEEKKHCAIMCSEEDFKRCHKEQLADKLVDRGCMVVKHIFREETIIHKREIVVDQTTLF